MQHSESVALRQQLDILTQDFTQLSGQLAQAAKDLIEGGKPPLASLSDEVTVSRNAFTSLCGDLVALAQTLAISPLPAGEELSSLSKLDSLLQVVAEAEDKRARVEDSRRTALDVTEQVLAISHTQHPAFEPLVECQAKARELHHALSATTWPAIHPDGHDLAQRKHPLAILLALVHASDDLDDDQWAEYQETVTQAFGKALAVAASRGKLTYNKSSDSSAQPQADSNPTLKSEEKSGEKSTTPAGEPVSNGSEPAVAQALPPAQSIAPSSPSVQAAPSSPPPTAHNNKASETKPVPTDAKPSTSSSSLLSALNALKELNKPEQRSVPVNANDANDANDANGRSAEKPEAKKSAPSQAASSSRPAAGVSAVSAGSAGSAGSARSRAAAILEEDNAEERSVALRDLICQLLLEHKTSLAFHLAGCLDKQTPQLQPRLPVWLLRALTIAPYIRSANSPLISLLKADLGLWSVDCAGGESTEWRQAVNLLSVAATLQPALCGSQTQAPTILGGLQLGSALPQLSAYCELIGDFGKKNQPLDPVMFRKRQDLASWQAEMENLRQAVESWWSRAPRVSLKYDPATKVWRKWQEPKGLLHSLFLAIRQNDPSKLPIAQSLVEKLADDDKLQHEVQHTDRHILGRVLGDDITGKHFDQLRGAVRESVDFAQRWVELQEARPGRPTPKHAEQLRQEVNKRHNAVLKELQTVQQGKPALVLNAGIECCHNALWSVWEIFSPKSKTVGEPAPRAILGAELSRVPFLTIDDTGEVTDSDPESLIDVILDLLANGLLDEKEGR